MTLLFGTRMLWWVRRRILNRSQRHVAFREILMGLQQKTTPTYTLLSNSMWEGICSQMAADPRTPRHLFLHFSNECIYLEVTKKQ